jgi:hypothetical protein
MRTLSDRSLAEPYRRWIDGGVDLPPDVVLVPRTIDVGRDLLMLLAITLPMGVVSMFFLMMASRVRPATDGWAPFLFTAAVGVALWIAPVLLLRRLVRTIGASADRKRGALRQGIFVGTEGVLVRMEPNGCHPIAAERFVSAKHVHRVSTAHSRPTMVAVETLDGTIQIFADRLDGHPGRITQAAADLWPKGKKPKARPRPRVKGDHTRTVRLRRAAKMLGHSVVAFFIALAVLRIAGASWSTPAVKGIVIGLLLLAACAVFYVAFEWVRMRGFYRCPQCRTRVTRVPAPLPSMRYFCAPCNVEWDTGLEERDRAD